MPDDIPQIYFYNHCPKFNKALWIYYTDDQEFKIKKVSLWRTLYELFSKPVIRINNNTIVYMGSRKLIEESKQKKFKPLEWQITWLAVSEWISRNWDIDQFLSFISNRSYYGNGYFGLVEASKGYFGKSPKELNDDEICMLIATTRNPAQDNPKNSNERFLKKVGEVGKLILQSKNWH
jgi:membrane carboxypeptidase/penicillin-binding protein PbpC